MGLSEEAIGQAVEQLLDMAVRSETFSVECLSLMSCGYDDPTLMEKVFSRFVYEVLVRTGFEKTKLLTNIQRSVCKSPVLLDGFLLALYDFNGSAHSRSVTGLHVFLNKELPKEDWSALSCSRLYLKIDGAVHRGVLDMCVFELVFAHSRPEEIAQSGFVNVEAKDTYSLLGEEARNNFADAVLLKCRGDTMALITKLVDSDVTFAHAVFRRRNDLSLLIEAMSIGEVDREFYSKIVVGLYERKLQKRCDLTLALFLSAVLPNAHIFSESCLASFIQSPDFPSDDPIFPVDDFLASKECLACMNLRVFFHIIAVRPSEDFVTQYLGSVVAAQAPVSVFAEIFSTAEKEGVYDYMKFLFLYYIENAANLTQEAMRDAIFIFMPGHASTVCDFCLDAITKQIKPELFLNTMALEAFFDHSFLNPSTVLQFLFDVTRCNFDNPAISEFWQSPLTIPSVVDAILSNHACAHDLTEFLLMISRVAPDVFIESIGDHLRDLPCFKQFSQNCKARFPPDSQVIRLLNDD